jgi:hypothetical protein
MQEIERISPVHKKIRAALHEALVNRRITSKPEVMQRILIFLLADDPEAR